MSQKLDGELLASGLKLKGPYSYHGNAMQGAIFSYNMSDCYGFFKVGRIPSDINFQAQGGTPSRHGGGLQLAVESRR